MDGNALRVGWDERFIVAKRVAVLGGAVGWMILDAKAETLQGPFTDDEFESKRRASPELAAMDVRDVESAWATLR